MEADCTKPMLFSLIVPTRGRTEEVGRLFRSLRDQTLQDFEVILSDQNDDDRLVPIVRDSGLTDRFIHLKSSGGASRARNEGLARSSGDIVCFPDDDCIYPPGILKQVAEFFACHPEYGLLTGCSYADDGGDSVSRFAKQASDVQKMTIHAQCVEFTIFIRRSALGTRRFDEQMGVGSLSPWHSDEGPDLILRLQGAGARAYFDPKIAIWHAQPVTSYGAKDVDRAYRYACGTGYFYRKHDYPFWYFAYFMSRTLGGLLLALATLKPGKARFYLARFRGMWRGWRSMPVFDGSLAAS